MSQIQYPAYTQPPAFTPPTTDADGWRETEPDQQWRSRWDLRYGKGSTAYAALYTSPSVETIAPEKFTIPGTFVDRITNRPTSPTQFINRRDYRGRGGGYQFFNEIAVFALEQLNPKLGWGQAETPDNPEIFRKRGQAAAVMQTAFTTDLTVPTVTLTDLRVFTIYPSTTARVSLPRADHPNSADFVIAPEQFAPTLLWSVTYPDTTQRASLQTADQLWKAQTIAPEKFAATLLWSVTAPSTTARASLKTAAMPFFTSTTAVENFDIPPLSWKGSQPEYFKRRELKAQENTWFTSDPTTPVPVITRLNAFSFAPDTTRKARLAAAEYSVIVRPEALGQFSRTLLATTTFPDTTRRATWQIAQAGKTLQMLPLPNAVPQIPYPVYPSTTRRNALKTAELPSFFSWFPIPRVIPEIVAKFFPIRRLRRSPMLTDERQWLSINKFQLDVEAGTGLTSGQGSDPQVILQWSDDKGHTWSNEHPTSAGKKGEYRRRAMWWRLGRTRERIFQVSVSDPVRWSLLDAIVNFLTGRR